MDDNTNTNNNSGKNTDNVVRTVNVDSRHNNKGGDKRKNTDISPFTSEDEEDNTHKGNSKTKTKEKPTHSKQDKVAGTTGANVTAAEASILQKTEVRRMKEKELKEKNDFAKLQTIDKVLWGKDKDGKTIIVQIGGCPLKAWNAQMLPTFCRTLGIIVPENSKKRNDCIQHIIDFYDTGVLREYLQNGTKSGGPKKIDKKTVPKCVHHEGTYIRAILTYTSEIGRDIYTSTNHQLTKDKLDSRAGHSDAYGELLVMFNDESDLHLATTNVDLSRYAYAKDESSRFDKNLTSADLKQIIDHITWWYNFARNAKNQSGKHLDFIDFDQGKAFVFFLHETLFEIGDKDLMNASHATLEEDVYSTSQGVLQSPSTSSTTSRATTTRTTPGKRAMDNEKHKVATSIVDKNKKVEAFMIVQKEKEEVQKKKAKHEYNDSLFKTFDELESLTFETKMELRTLDRKILLTTDEDELSDYNAHKELFLKKIARNEKRMEALKAKMNDDTTNNNN